MAQASSFDVNSSGSEPLKKNWGVLSEAEKAAAASLIDCNQAAIFAEWPAPGTEDADKKALLAQVAALNSQYPGGLKAYQTNGIRLLADSKKGVNPYEGFEPSVPAGERLEFNSEAFHEFEKLGLVELGRAGFVLVAGGLGERLGYPGVKPELPIEITTETSFLESYCRSMLAFQKRARDSTGNKDIKLPLAIMVSDDTAKGVRTLMDNNKNFGLDADQVDFMHQQKVVALTNNSADFAMKSKYVIETKPGGHGSVHSLLYSGGIAAKWEKAGIRWLVFMQDTNGAMMRGLVSSIGVSAKNSFALNSICCPRRPGQAIGAITKLDNAKTGASITINVEYNQLGPLLESTGDKKGDVADASGYSLYPGNTNSLIFGLNTYNKVMEVSKGVIPEFVNPKYADAEKTKFKKPTRLESMMQEYPKLLSGDVAKQVGMTQLPGWLALEPVKNNIVDAKTKYETIGEAMSASSGEAGIYFANRSYLRAAGAECEECKEKPKFAGIGVRYGARVVLQPSFGVTVAEVKSKVKNCKLSQESTLILEGDNISIDGLELDGALVVKAEGGSKVVLKGLKVNNDGWRFKEVDPASKDLAARYAIRGYVLDKKAQRVIEFSDGKEHVVSE